MLAMFVVALVSMVVVTVRGGRNDCYGGDGKGEDHPLKVGHSYSCSPTQSTVSSSHCTPPKMK